ncbi:MAG: creatininase family protein [bacterium]|nr:creatininase family protein [bacterium]
MTLTKLGELTYPQIAELIKDGEITLLFPVGTLEPHGRHAPVGTDNFCAEEIAWELGKRTGWPVAPTLNYGITSGLIAYPGGVKIPKLQYEELIKIILENFLQMGFRRIIIINGHGGNTESIGKVIKDLIVEDRGNRHFINIDWWYQSTEPLKEIYGRPGGHAALDETACILVFRPELVREGDFSLEEQSRMKPGVTVAPYSSAVLVYEEGDASPDFDREKATKFVERIIDNIEEILKEEVRIFEKSFGRL